MEKMIKNEFNLPSYGRYSLVELQLWKYPEEDGNYVVEFHVQDRGKRERCCIDDWSFDTLEEAEAFFDDMAYSEDSIFQED